MAFPAAGLPAQDGLPASCWQFSPSPGAVCRGTGPGGGGRFLRIPVSVTDPMPPSVRDAAVRAPAASAARIADRKFFRGLARAFGGAVLFSLPLLMTMEMWALGFALERAKLLV